MDVRKILIIEDDVMFSKTLKNVLTAYGYDALVANSGAEGIQKAYEFSPDLILCDINMSPIDGYQVFNILEDSSVTNKIPFIYITGKSDLEDIRLGMELGADDYIVKPFSNEELLKSIKVRLAKYEKLVNIGKSNYQALVELSPNGIFIFDGETIYEVNNAFTEMTGYTPDDLNKVSFKDIVDEKSFISIQTKVLKCAKGLMKSFDEQIILIAADRRHIPGKLYVTASQKFRGFTLLIGLLETIEVNLSEYDRLVNILSEEKVDISGKLATRLQREFEFPALKQATADRAVATNIFSKREQEVLRLSCRGLPVKIIADELCISDRTVEKHRASLMEKTGSKNIVEVIIYALKNDLIVL